MAADVPHLPGRHQIDGYGRGGFRFGGMSHRGSILALPSGIYAWPVVSANALSIAAFERAMAEAGEIDVFLLGTGPRTVALAEDLRWRLREAGLRPEAMDTAAAARTYNVLFQEDRRVAAALMAVD